VKTRIAGAKCDRIFKFWEYQVSHRQLLIRSPKQPATINSNEQTTNIDLVFVGVDYLAIPRTFNGIAIEPAVRSELAQLESVLGLKIDPPMARIIVSEQRRFPVVASNWAFYENDWDIFASPFEFRSNFQKAD
jgi:hypothetical protein